MNKISPLMEQFFKIKEQYDDHILFFRVGDFYEMFFDDAYTASRELDLTLTGKRCGMEHDAPMCGVPFHSCDGYIAKLVQKGYKVAICEQMQDPTTTKGLVEREVIRVITPGTVSDQEMLSGDKNNYLACIVSEEHAASVTFADISTGEIYLTSFYEDIENHLQNELCKYMPSEVLCEQETLLRFPKLAEYIKNQLGALITAMDKIDAEDMETSICTHFHVSSPEQLKLDGSYHQKYCLYYLLFYIKLTQKCDISYLNRLEVYSSAQFMELDLTARRNLELTETMRAQDKKGSLLHVLNRTKSAMGTRLFHSYIERPLLSPVEIDARLSAVENLNADTIRRTEIQTALKEVYDIERLMTKVMYKSANPRDLLALSHTISRIPKIKAALKEFTAARLTSILDRLDDLQDIYTLIFDSIDEQAGTVTRNGKFIKKGYSAEIDEYRALESNVSDVIHQMEDKEKERTGIKNLKIGNNRVFGYYIEVTRSYFDLVPEEYIRKQTLLDKERFITPELKDLEYKIINAKDKALALELSLYSNILEKIAQAYYRIRTAATALAELDVLCSFSQIAQEQNYVRPEIYEGDELEIIDGRHPVVEHYLKDTMFVPNDLHLGHSGERIMIITGPNMGGKSTYMRQNAVIVIMAQIGCFVPARRAKIGIVDKIFTRVGASDDLAMGQSTFMVEMAEVAHILKNATPKSLLLLDEIGRGTSTFDGMSIARAVLEYIATNKKIHAKTLFATHYHELCELEQTLDDVVNFNVTVKRRDGKIVFLRKIVRGGADESYGIDVASLAGVPSAVVNRAKEILSSLSVDPPSALVRETAPSEQLSLSDFAAQKIMDELKTMDVSTLTPIEAISKLYEFSNTAKKDG